MLRVRIKSLCRIFRQLIVRIAAYVHGHAHDDYITFMVMLTMTISKLSSHADIIIMVSFILSMQLEVHENENCDFLCRLATGRDSMAPKSVNSMEQNLDH